MLSIEFTYNLYDSNQDEKINFYALGYRYEVEGGYFWHYLKLPRETEQRHNAKLLLELVALGFRQYPSGELRMKEPVDRVGQGYLQQVRITPF